MARVVERGSRGKAVALRGGDFALPAATSQQAGKSRCPSRKREGSKEGREGSRGAREEMKANPFMPGLRVRSDGWTVTRTRVFLATLGQTGCITDAARIAGVSTTSVNRSRALFPPFDKACAEAIARALRGLEAVAYERAVEGREMVILRNGKEVERRIVPSDSLLGLLLKRGDLKNGRDVQLTAEEAAAYELPAAVRDRFLSREEYFSGMVFAGSRDDPTGGKRQGATQEETDEVLLKRIAMLKRYRDRPQRPHCAACGQGMPLTDAESDAFTRADRDGTLEQQLAGDATD